MALILSALLAFLACSEEAPDPRPSEASTPTEAEAEAAKAPVEAVDAVLTEATAEPLGQHVADRYPASLETVLETRFLRVLTSRNAFDFFLNEGERGGYQYEMVRGFTRFLNERHERPPSSPPIQFELIPVDDDQLIPLLLEGAGDLIAARLTITPTRAEQVAFSKPYQSVDERVVAHDQAPPLERLDQLSGRTVAVRASSSFAESLAGLDRTLAEAGFPPVAVFRVDGGLETERIVELVAARRFPYTVADSLVAETLVDLHPTLRIAKAPPLREGGKLAWATRHGADGLLAEMNAFLRRHRQGSLRGNIAIKRYFKGRGRVARRLAEAEERGLSDYDALFREHAARFDLDWRLVAAMAHQESRFDAAARNRSGAVGLLQIKPATAREPYVGIADVAGAENASNNVHAGLKYLDWIKRRYFDSEPDMRERDRLRMALAAYNAGPRTVLLARRRAEKQGLDPDRWFRHVEVAMLGMRKAEPVKYVSEINQRYLSYVLMGIE